MSDQEWELELDDPSTSPQLVAHGPGAQVASEERVDRLLGEADQAEESSKLQRRARQRQPQGSPRLLIYRLLNGLVDRLQGSRVGSALLVVAIVGSLAVIWFSLTQRGALITQGHAVAAERDHVAMHLDELRQALEQRDLGTVMENVSQAESRVFTDYQQLAEWLAAQHRYAERLALNFRYTLGEASPSQVKNMLEVPIAMQVAVAGETAGLGYLSILEFLKNVIDARWYVEIVSAALVGEAIGVNEMRADLKVWVHGTTELAHEEATQ